jgi:hypothetical protein
VKRTSIAAALLALAGCAGPAPLPPRAPQPILDPAAFFAGRTHGAGSLDKLVGGTERIRVESVGTRAERGRLILDQRIWTGDQPPRDRRWVLRQAGPNRWTGTLSDATGPVSITAAGNSAVIRYAMEGGVEVEQQLRLQPDRRTLLNQLTARKWGMPVAWLDETIRKLD